MNNLLTIKNETVYIATDILAIELKRKHQTIVNLVTTYENELKTLGVLRFEIAKHEITKKGGAPKKVYYLNKKQYIFLITNMRTKANELDTVMKAKLEIADKFVEMEKSLLQIELNHKNKEWIDSRQNGKQARKEFTDILKQLLEITKENNPESTYVKKPNLLYSNFTRMIYRNLFAFNTKIKNPRESMSSKQLFVTGCAELAALKSIQDGLDENKDAKEIYKITNVQIEKYAEIMGKSTIIDMITNNQISMLEDNK